MGLDIKQIKEEVQERRKRSVIAQAIAHQNRVKFHTQIELSSNISQPATDFITMVSGLLPEDKLHMFKLLFRYPVKTNEVTGTIFNQFYRIFSGKNPAFYYQFINSEYAEDWEYYRHTILNEPEIWKQKGWRYFQTEFNSIMVVDMPVEADDSDRFLRPYFYWITLDRVITYDSNEDGTLNWIIYGKDDSSIIVIDDERYRVFEKDKDGGVGPLIVDNPHDIGYCPARFFWSDSLNILKPDIKESPITKVLEDLDWYLFYYISKKHLDLYGSYPIYSGYEGSCDFSREWKDGSGNVHSEYCDKGFLRDRDNGNYVLSEGGALCRCPLCSGKRIAGPGSWVEIPIPQEGQPDLRNPVQMLTVDSASLQYNVDELLRKRKSIIATCVGTGAEDDINHQAINEEQVSAFFQTRTTILQRIKKGFEDAQKFIDLTVARLRYGSENIVSFNINYGTEFFDINPQKARQDYKLAKESGASEAELDALQDKIIESEYRNNPVLKQRMMLLADLEPYRHLSIDEVVDKFEKQIISREDMLMKINFSTFVKRFERENINVNEFGLALPYYERIEKIKERFKTYVKELENNTN